MPLEQHNTASPSAKIGKTRQEPPAYSTQVGPPRGVLQATENRSGSFFHHRLAPPEELSPWVQHFWYVQWDLRGLPSSRAGTLPHPNSYLVFEHDLLEPPDSPAVAQRAEVSGVTTRKFSRSMEGHGRVFGLKFTPGGLRPFLQTSTSALTDRVVPAREVFGENIVTLAFQLRTLDSVEVMAEATSLYLKQHLPPRDTDAEQCAALVALIFNDPAILTVEKLSDRTAISVRTLQRLFKEYVGVSPKWVIRRYRLHDLIERLHTEETFDGARIAAELGYTDQSHLINDFRKLSGYTPTEYKKRRR